MPLNVAEIKLDAEGSGDGSTSRYDGAIATGKVLRKVSKWVPIYMAWTDDRRAGAVLAVDDVDPVRLQCTVSVTDGPGGIVRCHELRFLVLEGLEWYLNHADRCALADRQHRCTICLEWIYGWLERSPHCPVCRAEWRSGKEAALSATVPSASAELPVPPVPGASGRKFFSRPSVRKLLSNLAIARLTMP